ncbi:MAG: hypothetical protein EP314_01125, partial [Bacteroidetes bacterium]
MRFINTLKPLLILLCFSAHSKAQECGIIYVSPAGASGGATGTRANPASLQHALTLTNATNNVLWLATGTYNISNAISIPNDVTIEGGFNGANWVKSNANTTIINRTSANPLPPPANALVGIAGLNASGFRLQDLTINVEAASGNGTSVYGIYLAACSNYNIVRCEVTTGAGGAGLPGIAGAPGAPGGPGTNGLAWGYENAPPPGGAGGIGANNGGNGGISARWNGSSPGGQAGSPAGCGGTGGNAGSGANCGCGLFGTSNNSDCEGNMPQPGQPGGVGTAGTAGAGGPAGTYATGYFVPGGPGGNGTAGGNGCGGGGGGGGGGRQQSGNDQTGGSGGGGGGGGFGGTGG